MEQQIREQIAHLQRESRFLRNLAVPFLSPLGFLFAVFLYLSARDIYRDADAQQPENWSSPEQFLEVSRQIREESVWKLHTRLILLLTFYVIDMISYPTVVLAVNMAVTLALCALYEWGLRRFEKRTGI